jgi:hypothetical protein
MAPLGTIDYGLCRFHWVLDGEVEEDPLGQKRVFVDYIN